jgi:hypothetical protein
MFGVLGVCMVAYLYDEREHLHLMTLGITGE